MSEFDMDSISFACDDAPITSDDAPLAGDSVPSSIDTNKSFVPKKKSDAWKYFVKIEEIVNGKKVYKAQCNFCDAKLSCCGTNGTSHLKRHGASHVNSLANGSDIRHNMLLAKDKMGMLATYQFDNERARLEIVEFIVRAELPFSFVNSHDFSGMIKRGFAPQFKKFSNQTCKRDVMKMFSESKADLIAYFDSFKGKVCFTSDMWSSRQKMGYMSLTAHWIDDTWIMQKRILSFKMVEYPHTGESLAAHMHDELIAWHLHAKLFTLTLDNASSNDVLVDKLSDHLMLRYVCKRLLHVRCTCHILNLIVQDGLAVLSPSISKITTIVRSLNSSIKRHELWVKSCVELGFPRRNIDIDVPHRWNSTYELLIVAVRYKTILHRYASKVNESRSSLLDVPTDVDWLNANLCMNFFAIFSSTTKVCSGVYSPTSNRVINSIVDIYDTFKAYQPLPSFKTALDAMKLKFDKYWREFPMVFCLATVMDPRFKILAIQSWLSVYDLSEAEIELKVINVKTILGQVYETYKRSFAAAISSPLPASDSMHSTAFMSPNSIDVNIPVVGSASMTRLKRARISSSSATSDLQMYLDHDIVDAGETDTFNVLSWWKTNSCMYPILAVMAKDILSIPASTVASEAAFSAGGRVVSEKRASLSPDTIEALVCLKDWSLAKSRGQEAAAEEAAAEELMNVKASRPEWLTSDEDFSKNYDSNLVVVNEEESAPQPAASNF